MRNLFLIALSSSLLLLSDASLLGQVRENNVPSLDSIAEDSRKYARIEQLTEKLKAEPKNVSLLKERAEIYGDLDNLEAKLADLNRAVAANPQSLENLLSIGEIMLPTMPEPAIRVANKAIKLSNTDTRPLSLRARAHSLLGELDKSLLDIEAGLTITPKDFVFLAMKGNVLMHLEPVSKP